MSHTQPGNIDIFQILHQERATFGLRSGDYARYHNHLSSRIANLRSSLKLKHTSGSIPKPYKALPKLSGEEIKDARALELILLEAERAHTSSIQYRTTYLSSPPDSRTSQTLKSAHSRSLKSTHHASHLLSLLSSLSTPASPLSIAKAKVYALILSASAAFDKEKYDEALPGYIVAREVLGRLSEAEEGARGEARAFSWMDEEVDPRVRFCAYKLGRKDAHDVKGIVDEFQGQELEELLEEFEAKEIVEALKVAAAEQENGAEGKRKSGEVEWLGERIGFRNADVVGVMEKVGKAVSKLEELTAKKERENKVEGGKGKRQQQQQQQGKRGGKMKAYDRVLLELSEGVEKVKQIREDAENSNSSTNAGSSSSTGQPDSLSLLQDYLTHSLLTHRIARDLLLIRSQLHPFSSSRPTRRAAPSYTNITFSSSKGDGGEEKAAMDEKEMRVLPIVIKLYDGVIRAWEAVRELGAIERDGEVSEAVEAKVGFFRAKRIYYLSKLHLLLPPPVESTSSTPSHTTESLLLISRATLLVRQIQSLPPTYPSDTVPLSPSSSVDLSEELQKLEEQAKLRLYKEVHRGSGEGEEDEKDLAIKFVEILPLASSLAPKGAAKKGPSSSSSSKPALAGTTAGAGGVVKSIVKSAVSVLPAAVVGGQEEEGDDDSEGESEYAEAEEDVGGSEEEEDADEEEEEEEPKKAGGGSWLGGWFGRK